MGWTSIHMDDISREAIKAYCDASFDSDNVQLLKSSMVGSTYYAACRIITESQYNPELKKFEQKVYAQEDAPVVAFITLTRINRKSDYNFFYKDLDETMGPAENQCPVSILNLLTETESEFANEWRSRCRRYHEQKKGRKTLGDLPIGTKIRFKLNDGREVTLIKSPPAYQFKRSFWMVAGKNQYMPKTRIPDKYEIIKQ